MYKATYSNSFKRLSISRNAVAFGKMKLVQAVTALKLTLLIIKEVTLNLPFIYSKLTSINILANQVFSFDISIK